MDENFNIFVVYVVALEVSTAMLIYSSRGSQVQRLNKSILVILEGYKAPTKIPTKYTDFTDNFLLNLAMELLKNIGMNEHAIKLVNRKQPLYGFIYIFSPVELEILKTYIKTHLKIVFILSSKSFVYALILFNKKLNNSFCLCIDYQGLNNLTIKN